MYGFVEEGVSLGAGFEALKAHIIPVGSLCLMVVDPSMPAAMFPCHDGHGFYWPLQL